MLSAQPDSASKRRTASSGDAAAPGRSGELGNGQFARRQLRPSSAARAGELRHRHTSTRQARLVRRRARVARLVASVSGATQGRATHKAAATNPSRQALLAITRLEAVPTAVAKGCVLQRGRSLFSVCVTSAALSSAPFSVLTDEFRCGTRITCMCMCNVGVSGRQQTHCE